MNTGQFFILWMILFFFTSCSKEEQNPYPTYSKAKVSYGSVIGHYDDQTFNVLTLDLGTEICIITRNLIRIIPYDTTKQKFEMEGTFYGAVANEFDTIIQNKNTFYRFYPSIRKFEYLYSPPFTIHDFCVTPGHGIGYIWGNIFVEHQKFNYFSLETYENKTLFELQSFFPEGTHPYQMFQTYMKNDHLYLLYRTGSNYVYEGVFFNINLNDIKIENTLKYKGMGFVKVLNFNDYENLNLSFNASPSSKAASTFNIITGSEKDKYSVGGTPWWSSNNYIEGENISIYYFNYKTSQKLEFINWKKNIRHFSVDLPIEYVNIFSKVFHVSDNLMIVYNEKKKEAFVFDQKGEIVQLLKGKKDFKSIVYMDDLKIVALSEDNDLVLFHI